MKKYIFVLDALELMSRLIMGKRVEGVLFIDKNTGRLTFKAYNRTAPKRQPDRLVGKLENGWVKESPEKYKVFVSLTKALGLSRIFAILDSEATEAKNFMFDNELIDRI